MSYPILSYEEAISSLRQMFDLNVCEEELRRPTSQFVKKLMLDLATTSLGISREQMMQPPFKLVSMLPYPDILEEGASFIYYTLIVQRFLHSCLVKDFSKNDLTDPKPKRTLNIISAVVNYEKFKGTQNQHFDRVTEKKESVAEQKRLLQERNKELKGKIAKIKAARSVDEEKIQQVQPIVEDLKKEVNDLNIKQASDVKYTQQLKTEIAEQTSSQAELKVLIANNVEESEKLKAKIVTSPEKFLGELDRMSTAIETCKLVIEEKSRILHEKKFEESLNVVEDNSCTADRVISSVQDEFAKLQNRQKKYQEILDEAAINNEQLEHINFEQKNAKRQLTMMIEKKDRMERVYEKKLAAKRDELEVNKKDVEMLQKKGKQLQEQSSTDEELQEVLAKIKAMEEDYGMKKNLVKEVYEQMITSLNNYHEGLRNGAHAVLNAFFRF
ncbi:kinetochore protein Nuf2-like [Xenia sp. Carnegie-2017]|uniref:kinetochore protein Nuf2-like n=2 Tax=Xenia sp. Carnegie-2017 TaxID=2897299 RepID=UPI001F045CA8|nr:kinetochore protein Nuf2-like [Xenia sp. Carnegie-2017]